MAPPKNAFSVRARRKVRRMLDEQVPDGRSITVNLSSDSVAQAAVSLASKAGVGRRVVVTVKAPGLGAVRGLAAALPGEATAREVRVVVPQEVPCLGRVRLAQVRAVEVKTSKRSTSIRLRVVGTAPLSDLLNAAASLGNPAAAPLAVGSPDAHVTVSGDPATAALTTKSWTQFGPYPEGEAAAVEEKAAVALHIEGEDSRLQTSIDISCANPIGRSVTSSPNVTAIQIDADGTLTAGSLRIPARATFNEGLRADLRSIAGGAVTAAQPSDPRVALAAARRLAELSACGVLLRAEGLPDPIASALSEPLRTAISGPLPTWSARWEDQIAWHSAARAQRLAALKTHGGAFRLGFSPLVSVLLVTNRPEYVLPALTAIRAQTYPNLEIVLGMHGFTKDDVPAEARLDDGVTALGLDGSTTLGHAYGVVTRESRGDLLAKMDDDDHYGPEHIWDLVLAQAYSGAGLVGKAPRYTYLEGRGDLIARRGFADEEVWGRYLIGATMLVSRSALLDVGGWRPTPWAVDKALLDRFGRHGMGFYRTTGLGWAYVRRPSGHTWNADESYFADQAEATWSGDQAKAVLATIIA